MTRCAAIWTKIECDNADIVFRDHWAGLLEVACGECRVMVSYGGRERLATLPPQALISLLISLLEVARSEQRNCASAELLAAYLQASVERTAATGNSPVYPDA